MADLVGSCHRRKLRTHGHSAGHDHNHLPLAAASIFTSASLRTYLRFHTLAALGNALTIFIAVTAIRLVLA
jgi:hypothetical protein